MGTVRPVVLIGYFLRLGALGFGGPIALVGAMHRDLVEQRRWLTDEEYREGLAFSQLAPGPLAAQLAIYIGYIRAGIVGASAAGFAFVLPSFVLVLMLSWAYVRYGGLAWVEAVFYGVGAAVIGLITRSAYTLTRRTLRGDRFRWVVYALLAVTTVATGREIVALMVGAGLAAWVWQSRSKQIKQTGTAREGASLVLLLQLLVYFGFAGSFVFGSGLAIVPFLHGGVVLDHQWLTERQFVDAIAVALITPGPVVITTAFIGYLVAGFSGALAASVGTFVPCYLVTILSAPYFRRYGKRLWLVAVIDGVTAAATGAIAGAVIVMGQRAIVDLPTTLIALVALGTAVWTRVPEPLIVLAAAVAGVVLR